jgi:hypothetical protein
LSGDLVVLSAWSCRRLTGKHEIIACGMKFVWWKRIFTVCISISVIFGWKTIVSQGPSSWINEMALYEFIGDDSCHGVPRCISRGTSILPAGQTGMCRLYREDKILIRMQASSEYGTVDHSVLEERERRCDDQRDGRQPLVDHQSFTLR